MWALSVPSHNNTTRYYCGVRVHPETSEVYLAIDDNDDQPVHLNASVQPLIDMLTAVDSEERTKLENYLKSMRGKRVKPIDLIPQFLKERSLTEWPEIKNDEEDLSTTTE
jgi:hypothetical protein